MRLTTQWYSRVIGGIMNLEKPVIGAINGVAAGAGCNFALSCDILIASEAARFIQVFVRRGLIADMGGTFFLPRLIGLARAKELMFTADEVDATRALELGLVNKVVPADELLPAAMELAQRLAQGPTRAIGMIKNMLNRSFESSLEDAMEREAALQGIAVSTSDVREGIMSFFEKRPPDFSGKLRRGHDHSLLRPGPHPAGRRQRQHGHGVHGEETSDAPERGAARPVVHRPLQAQPHPLYGGVRWTFRECGRFHVDELIAMLDDAYETRSCPTSSGRARRRSPGTARPATTRSSPRRRGSTWPRRSGCSWGRTTRSPPWPRSSTAT